MLTGWIILLYYILSPSTNYLIFQLLSIIDSRYHLKICCGNIYWIHASEFNLAWNNSYLITTLKFDLFNLLDEIVQFPKKFTAVFNVFLFILTEKGTKKMCGPRLPSSWTGYLWWCLLQLANGSILSWWRTVCGSMPVYVIFKSLTREKLLSNGTNYTPQHSVDFIFFIFFQLLINSIPYLGILHWVFLCSD